MTIKKYVYYFGDGKADGNAGLRNLLGGKGANLAEMTNIGIPVPPCFTITTEVCALFYEKDRQYPEGLDDQLKQNIVKLEKSMGSNFGDPNNPLLLSVRSGARVSMPGMMDTVLNLGLNDETVQGLINKTKNDRFAYDSYRRFVQMFANVVLGMDGSILEGVLEKKKETLNVENDTELSAKDLKELVTEFKSIVKKETGIEFPNEPREQLQMTIDSVFNSWNNPRAKTYRNLNNIPHDWGTAVNVQVMVYGNMGEDSGTGVAFTRDPSTGERIYYGEYLKNAQGEDVVAGLRTPKPIEELNKEMPDVYKELTDIFDRLEKHYKDIQDCEFTIQQGKLYMLQTRAGKRTAAAAVKIATDMVDEGLIDREIAVKRVDPAQLDKLLHRRIDPNSDYKFLAKGLAASPGASSGIAVFTADDAAELGNSGQKVILVRNETSPDDIHGMAAAQGILTARGGMTSHAAIVARGMGTSCVAGCESLKVDTSSGKFTVNGMVVNKGDVITIDGSTGEVILGEVPMLDPELGDDFKRLMKWADKIRVLAVRTNADVPEDAKKALDFGAEGIGLCRTEHMFFGEDRLPIVQEMILSETLETRQKALDKLLPMQRSDFKEIFKTMAGLPVTIRLLDPPLHEFLPDYDELLAKVTVLDLTNGPEEEIEEKRALLSRISTLTEMNPMLGHRGCRLGITYPEIYEMQVKAIFEAVCELAKEGMFITPEVMIPLISDVRELKTLRELTMRIAEEVMGDKGITVDYQVGTMIELPRAALTADEIAVESDFFSFGTNDLTQTTFGFSRDDAESKFIPYYLEKEILDQNPFAVLEPKGVGELVRIGVDKGRSTKKDLKIGICGEHGGDPSSITFFHKAGLNYVSCSPFRVPVARLAAAQAQLSDPR